ncbi:DUF6376 family protein [Paenibacillus thailandensis]|uniref:DUF6376 family protein n=1 Tax=Paenibacillus thailandensis TaxID=393250 RepID=A0ABW5R491_9BACL
MIKRLFWIPLLVVLLSGCSWLDQVNQSLDYTGEAASYINEATQFAESLPGLAQQAVTDTNARESLIAELENMKARISEFNGLEAPEFAAQAHEQLVALNQTLLENINAYLEQIQNGIVDIQNSDIMQTVGKIKETMDMIQNL